MQQYDLNIILNPSLSSEQVAIEKEYVENTIKNASAALVSLDEQGNRRMAYAIQKEREGYYLYYTINAAGNPVQDIADVLRLRDHVRRVLVVKDRPEWKTKKA